MLFQFAYALKIEAFFLVPLGLINSIYDPFIASQISYHKDKFPDLESDRRGMRKDFEAAFSNLRGVGWYIILQEQNTSSQLSSSFLHKFLMKPP